MRAAARVAAVCAVAAGACHAEIGTDTYFCGPELLCPPDLACNPVTYSCDLPAAVSAFECPDGTQDGEPDDVTAMAPTLGELPCGYNAEAVLGCIADGADVDHLGFELIACGGADPRLELVLQYPVAMVPLELAVVDDAGAVVAEGEPCTPDSNFTGRDWSCVTVRPPAGAYHIRISAGDGGDCDGQCRFNQYLLFVRYPLAG